MFTVNGQRFETVAIARLVILAGWAHVAGAGPDQWGNVVGGCDWLVDRGITEDGERWITDCGAEAAYDDDHFRCAAGHEHTSMEAQEREGWAYAEDEYDAAVIARGGREFRPVGPNTIIDEREAARIMATL